MGSGSVLTGPVLVPGVAADGLQQEAVVGHGELAAGGTRAQDAGTTPGDTSPFHPPQKIPLEGASQTHPLPKQGQDRPPPSPTVPGRSAERPEEAGAP